MKAILSAVLLAIPTIAVVVILPKEIIYAALRILLFVNAAIRINQTELCIQERLV